MCVCGSNGQTAVFLRCFIPLKPISLPAPMLNLEPLISFLLVSYGHNPMRSFSFFHLGREQQKRLQTEAVVYRHSLWMAQTQWRLWTLWVESWDVSYFHSYLQCWSAPLLILIGQTNGIQTHSGVSAYECACLKVSIGLWETNSSERDEPTRLVGLCPSKGHSPEQNSRVWVLGSSGSTSPCLALHDINL